SVQGGADYQVTVYPAGAERPKPDERDRLPAAGRVRFLCRLPWWRPRAFKVHVTGFPEKEVVLRAWWDREDRQGPFSFVRPELLPEGERAEYRRRAAGLRGHQVQVFLYKGDDTTPYRAAPPFVVPGATRPEDMVQPVLLSDVKPPSDLLPRRNPP